MMRQKAVKKRMTKLVAMMRQKAVRKRELAVMWRQPAVTVMWRQTAVTVMWRQTAVTTMKKPAIWIQMKSLGMNKVQKWIKRNGKDTTQLMARSPELAITVTKRDTSQLNAQNLR